MRLITFICSAALAVCGMANALTFNDTLKVHFDHSVNVGETSLPAGDCTIQMLDNNSDNMVLVVRCESGTQATALVNRVSSTEPHARDASVTLSREGDIYKLDRVWLSDSEGFKVQ